MSKPCDRCHGTILFVKLDTGRPIPVDPTPRPDKGKVAARWQAGGLVGYVISAAKPLKDDHDLYMPHQATCKPNVPRVTASQRTPTLFD